MDDGLSSKAINALWADSQCEQSEMVEDTLGVNYLGKKEEILPGNQ